MRSRSTCKMDKSVLRSKEGQFLTDERRSTRAPGSICPRSRLLSTHQASKRGNEASEAARAPFFARFESICRGRLSSSCSCRNPDCPGMPFKPPEEVVQSLSPAYCPMDNEAC